MDDETRKELEAIRKRVEERDDSTAMESACGEYNCTCHDDIPRLLAIIEEQGREITALTDERDELLAGDL